MVKLARKRRMKRRYAIRKPKDYEVKFPGDLVEVDTLSIKLFPNQVRYQFSATDVISKWDGIRVYSRQTSFCAANFLDYLEGTYPLKIKAIQIDGGSDRTHREEFYELEEIELSLVEHNKQLSRWEYTCNYMRPHQGIDYLTLNEYYQNWLEKSKEQRR